MAIDARSLVALPPRIIHHRFSRKDTILYALGVGAGQNEGDLPFLYEEGLHALPTMPVILAYPGFWQREPQYGIDWKRVLHGEQSVIIHGPLPVEGEVRGEMTIEKIIDKGADKGALLYSVRRIFDAGDNRPIASVTQVSFLRGDGGCGSTAEAPPPPPRVPERDADAVLSFEVRPEQAFIYRLSGDLNPLHVDPAVAREAGLAGPILHGLCSYGFAGRALLALLCPGRHEGITRMDCRFTAPLFPGERVGVSVWRTAPGKAAFRLMSEDRGLVVLDNGYTEYEES